MVHCLALGMAHMPYLGGGPTKLETCFKPMFQGKYANLETNILPIPFKEKKRKNSSSQPTGKPRHVS